MSSKIDLSDLTRREFVQIGASIAATMASRKAWSSTSKSDRDFEHGDPLREFNYGQIEFRPGLHQTQLEQTHKVLMSLDEDSLLRPFRFYSGLPAPGFDLGGWYSSADNGDGPSVPGHTFGQWISALSRYYAITGDAETKAKIFRLLQGYAETVEPTGKFYDKCNQPAYVYDKLVCGLIDASKFAGYPDALKLLSGITAAAVAHLPGKACFSSETPTCGDEIYTLPENQLISWERGGDPHHLEIAREYLYDEYFDPWRRKERPRATARV